MKLEITKLSSGIKFTLCSVWCGGLHVLKSKKYKPISIKFSSWSTLRFPKNERYAYYILFNLFLINWKISCFIRVICVIFIQVISLMYIFYLFFCSSVCEYIKFNTVRYFYVLLISEILKECFFCDWSGFIINSTSQAKFPHVSYILLTSRFIFRCN